MKAISFFSGVGMFDLGLHAAGFEILAQIEFEDFAQDVLQARWKFFATNEPPKIYGDIRAIEAQDLPHGADLFIGGFPCQPFSTAGHRKGKDDNRNMWGDFARLISDYRPRWVVLENVSAITIPYDGNAAYALTVVNDLAQMGYNASWGIISAQDCGLPHLRERWWCIAKLDDCISIRQKRQITYKDRFEAQNKRELSKVKSPNATMANTNKTEQSQIFDTTGNRQAKRPNNQSIANIECTNTRNIRRLQPIARRRTEHRMDRKPNGLAMWMDKPKPIAGRGDKQYEHEPPRLVPSGTAPKWTKQMQALGNGGIPRIAYEIGKAIIEHDTP